VILIVSQYDMIGNAVIL